MAHGTLMTYYTQNHFEKGGSQSHRLFCEFDTAQSTEPFFGFDPVVHLAGPARRTYRLLFFVHASLYHVHTIDSTEKDEKRLALCKNQFERPLEWPCNAQKQRFRPLKDS